MSSTSNRKLRRYLALAAIAVALPVCARGAVELWVTGKYLPQREFDPAAWGRSTSTRPIPIAVRRAS